MKTRTSNSAFHSEKQGAVLLWAMFVTLLVLSSTFVVAALSHSVDGQAMSDRRGAQADAMARAGLAHAKNEVYNALQLSMAPPAVGTVAINGEEAQYSIAVDGVPVQRQDPSGLTRTETIFRVQGSATVEGALSVQREIMRGVQVPLFQYALFYQDEMHFMYPAPMVVNGPVHCNSDMYLYAHMPLTFNTNHFTVAGDLIGEKKFAQYDVDYAWGDSIDVNLRRWVSDPFDAGETVEYVPLEAKASFDWLGIANTGGFDSNFGGYDADGNGDYLGPSDLKPFAPRTLEQWSQPALTTGGGTGNTLRTQEHGVQTVELPEIADFNPYVPTPSGSGGDWAVDPGTGVIVPVSPGTGTHEEGSFYAEAGLRIQSTAAGGWVATDGDGNDVSAAVAAAISSTTTYDARQAEGSGNSIQMTTIDMALLQASGAYPANGLIYVNGEGAGTGTDVKGFQLTNGAEIPGDLSVVSPDSIYVQGDFNTVAPKTAAVMADAVNLLSNSWDNSKAPGVLPVATPTTYNLSIVAGDTEATASNFNGGPHNLPRFHENWLGVEATILGSMVCLWHSDKANADFFVSGDYYEAPDRVWTFDTRLRDVNQLPPFTPQFIEVEELVLW